MSDYGKLQEIEDLYNKAVEYGMIPPNWDGTPPQNGGRSAEHKPPERHGEHREGKRS